MEVLYFKFIGQISCNSHEYYTCNISVSMGQKRGAGAPGGFQQHSDSGLEKSRSGNRDKCSSLAYLLMRVVGALVDASTGTMMIPRLCSCCFPIEQGPGSQKAGKLPCLCYSVQFQPNIYHTPAINKEFFTNSSPCLQGDDLLACV